jgi:hypothetical protein
MIRPGHQTDHPLHRDILALFAPMGNGGASVRIAITSISKVSGDKFPDEGRRTKLSPITHSCHHISVLFRVRSSWDTQQPAESDGEGPLAPLINRDRLGPIEYQNLEGGSLGEDRVRAER